MGGPPLWLTVLSCTNECRKQADSAWRLLQLAIELAWVARSSVFFCTDECRKQSFHLVGGPFLAFQAAFSLEEHFLGQRALTIEHSVMSGCGQGHEPAKNL